MIRDHSIHDIDDNDDLSIFQFGQHPNINSDGISNVVSEYTSSVYTNKDSSDIDFDPDKVTHSSTMAEDSAQVTQSPKTVNFESPGTESSPTDVTPCASSTQKTIITNSTSIKIPLPSKGSCDNSKLKAESSIITDELGVVTVQPRWKKKYFCIYCHKLVVKLPRHIETKHKDLEEVQQLKNTPKGE